MKPIALLLEKAFNPESLPLDSDEPPVAQCRRKIWQLPLTWHCPLIGTCLTVAELRRLAKRAGLKESGVPDYALHSIVVSHCAGRSEVAEQLQRFLDRRHALSIRHFSQAKDGDAVLAVWHGAFAERNFEGSLWAAWTHPDTDEYIGALIYGEMHMLSHRLGATERAEKKRLIALEQGNVELHKEIAALRQNLTDTQRERERSIGLLETRLAENKRLSFQFKQDADAVAAANEAHTLNATLHERNAALEQRLATCQGRIANLEDELFHARNALRKAATNPRPVEPPAAAPAHMAASSPISVPDIRLDGYRILCIGGRTGMVDHYRRLVEAGGGHFVHHDGGLEDNEHRIDAIVSGVDVVVCQIGYISHPAYWRIKSVCKQRGLPCIFQKSGGITTFARNLEMLAGEACLRGAEALAAG